MTRDIHLAIDIGPAGSDSWRLVAECDDEMTVMVVMNGKGLTMPDESDLEGELGRMLIADHRGRCGACKAWLAPADSDKRTQGSRGER